jgi:hypothetical protein
MIPRISPELKDPQALPPPQFLGRPPRKPYFPNLKSNPDSDFRKFDSVEFLDKASPTANLYLNIKIGMVAQPS